jgi:hypothetical protein
MNGGRWTWRFALVVVSAAALLLAVSAPVRGLQSRYLRVGHAPITARSVAAPVWCGSGASSSDRKPDFELSSERQVHVLYAYPADRAGRFDQLASPLATDVGAIGEWWRKEDPTRGPRWDLYAFPGCTSEAGMLDLASVRLPRPSSAYEDSNDIDTLTSDLLGVVGPLEKALVYYDGPRSEPRVCGTSWMAPLYAGRLGFAYVFLRAACNGDVGAGGAAAVTAAHELTHSLGAVPLTGPPHVCQSQGMSGHVCDDPADLMFPFSSGLPLAATTLDTGNDDYYAHSGTWWDVQDSPWLSHLPQHRLEVAVVRHGGSGRVTSSPAGIDCGTSCAASWDDGLTLQLRAVPEPGARLWSWSGSCTGWGDCKLELRDTSSVGATFGPNRYRIAVSIHGRGRVLSVPGGLACRGTCGAWFAPGTTVRLRAKPLAKWRFGHWSGACTGAGACLVRADADLAVGATFTRR